MSWNKSKRKEKIRDSIDKLKEAEFFIRTMEHFYHQPNYFRYALNGFLKSLDEIPAMIQHQLQQFTGFTAWFRPCRAKYYTIKMISNMNCYRRTVVHKHMLVPDSTAGIGAFRYNPTTGWYPKMNLWGEANPWEPSHTLIARYALATQKANSESMHTIDLFGLLDEEEENTIPGVQREWRLSKFPGQDILRVCVSAWNEARGLISQVVDFLGLPAFDLDVDLRPKGFYQVQVFKVKDIKDMAHKLNQLI